MQIYSVSEVNKYIKNLFETDRHLTAIYIRGEISNYKQHYSGHCYFTLKDSEATIRAVMFRSRAQFIKFEPRDGLKVIVNGYISVFERDGQFQIYVQQLIPDGVGELSLAYEQLKTKLAAEGLFDEARKRPLPLLPKSVGIITSPTGAAVRDIITVAKRRHRGVQLILFPVQVQGNEAPDQIVQAIKTFNKLSSVDVIIAGRGGGSLEELWAFNTERVVRAIAGSVIPIVSAVGHQTDYTLADFAADIRAATPSQAAEIVVPDVKELSKYIYAMQTMLENHMINIYRSCQNRLLQCQGSRVFKFPAELLSGKQQIIDDLFQRLNQSFKHGLLDKQHVFRIEAEKLAVLNPLAVLARGYSITRTDEGRVLRNSADVSSGCMVNIILAKGSIDAKVLRIKPSGNMSRE